MQRVRELSPRQCVLSGRPACARSAPLLAVCDRPRVVCDLGGGGGRDGGTKTENMRSCDTTIAATYTGAELLLSETSTMLPLQ